MDQAVILAAGESSRFWPLNYRHKSLFFLMGKPLIWWTINGLKKAGLKEVIVVQSPDRNIENELSHYNFGTLKIKYVVQKKPLGTGNALFQAKNLLRDSFFVLNGDVLNSEEILTIMLRDKKEKKARAILAGQKTKTPWLFGMMKLRGDRILKIIEKPQKGKEPSEIKVVGVYFLEKKYFNYYQGVRKHPYDFEDALTAYMEKNEVKLSLIKKSESETPSFIKYPWHLFPVRKYLFDLYLKNKIERDTEIAKNVILNGRIFVGRGTKIFEGTVIKGPCYIGENCIIGNNVLIREYTNLEDGVIIGAFCEVARSIFQKHSSTHSGYFGDSIIGEGTKIGAGTIISNVRLDRGQIYCKVKMETIPTGLHSFGAVVGKNTMIGTKVNIMPGKFIGSNCKIYPGSLIIRNIPDGSILKFAYYI